MCHVWKFPTRKQEEITPGVLDKLPQLGFCNITGGEPFLRDDIEEIVAVLQKKAKRIVISTNGYLSEKIIDLAGKNRDIGIRVSIDGMPAANADQRGLADGFEHGLTTLQQLQALGLKDIGFGVTLSDRNAQDLMSLYQMAKSMKIEFATAVVHNSFYFHKCDNEIVKKEQLIASLEELIRALLKSNKPKNWYRAYFNYGLINYVRGEPRLLPCEAGTENFFVDPWGEILPCNGFDSRRSMGNLNEMSFEEIWNGERAKDIRQVVGNCPKNCWMIGTAAPVMKKYIRTPTSWVLKNKWPGKNDRD